MWGSGRGSGLPKGASGRPHGESRGQLVGTEAFSRGVV